MNKFNTDLRIQERLSAYLDGELDAADRGAVDALLSENPHYAELLERWRQNSIKCRALPKVQLDDGFADRVLEQVG